jgi:hypothetical protein
MRFLARYGVLVCLLAAAACTVDNAPEAGSSPGAGSSVGATSASARPCPWNEERGQEYEAETGRIRLVVACLGDAHRAGAGGGFVYSGPDSGGRDLRFTDGTTVAVLCVDSSGDRFADSAGHTSTVWFQVEGSFAGGPGASGASGASDGGAADATGWVPHAATGYARAAGQDPC